MPGEQAKTGSLAAGAMICPKCGQLGPMQLGCAVVLGMSVMASSDGVVDFPWNPARDGKGRRIWSAQHPSRN